MNASDFPLTESDGRRYRHLPLRNTNKKFNPTTARTLLHGVGQPETGEVRTHEFVGAQEIGPVFGDGRPAVWRWSRPLIDKRPDDLVAGSWGRARRAGRRLPEGLAAPGPPQKLRTIWLAEEIGSTDTAVAEAQGDRRPRLRVAQADRAAARILSTMPDDILVLDFFAGSGTTGHAVALQNAEDGGTRRCVGINSAEPTRDGSNARNAGLLTVADITRARLRAVADRVGGGLHEA